MEETQVEEEEIETEHVPLDKRQMQLAERELEQRQYIEYQERIQKEPDTQVALDNRLLRIDARLSTKKEMIPDIVKMPDGTLRAKAFEVEEDYPEIFNEDLIKGNYGSEEQESVWGNALFASYLKHFGQSRGIDLKPACRFSQANEMLFVNISRGKGMASAMLTKTDKHLSEGAVNHIYKTLEQKKEKKWGFM